MKNKKRLGFLSAIMGACLTVTSLVGNVAFAEENAPQYTGGDVKAVAFYKHEVNYFKDGDKVIDLGSKDYSSLKLKVEKDGSPLTEGKEYLYDDGEITDDSTYYTEERTSRLSIATIIVTAILLLSIIVLCITIFSASSNEGMAPAEYIRSVWQTVFG
jgi:hypothetical protein